MNLDKPITIPREAKTIAQICKLPRDNVGTDDFWMWIECDSVTIVKQKFGEDSEFRVRIPRKVFETFVNWYNTGKFKKPRKKRS